MIIIKSESESFQQINSKECKMNQIICIVNIKEIKMGGDSFEGQQKLTNEQYQLITKHLIQKLSFLCVKILPYIPLPEKQVHGDIDFLVQLKKQFNPKDLIQYMKIEKFILNNNQTINSVYQNKQIDYFFVENQSQFELTSFYKSYSGIGAFLGVFLPSKQIKITTEGIYALGFHKHLKLQYLICDKVEQILNFYGLNYEQYKKGFSTRKQLFEYLRKVKFLDEQKFAYHQHKNPTKLIKFFSQYLKNQGIKKDKHIVLYQDSHKQTLQYFNKLQSFKAEFQKLLKEKERQKLLNSKFNATHVMGVYGLKGKLVNELKHKYRNSFQSQKAYYDYIENNDLESLINDFAQNAIQNRKMSKQRTYDRYFHQHFFINDYTSHIRIINYTQSSSIQKLNLIYLPLQYFKCFFLASNYMCRGLKC